MPEIVEIEDILFVFGRWTLVLKSEHLNKLKPGAGVNLYDKNQSLLGSASLGKYLSSKNPDISVVEVDVDTKLSDMKIIKYISPKTSLLAG